MVYVLENEDVSQVLFNCDKTIATPIKDLTNFFFEIYQKKLL